MLSLPILLISQAQAYDIYYENADETSVVPNDVDPCVLLPGDLFSSVAKQNSLTMISRLLEPVPEKTPDFLVGQELYDAVASMISKGDLSLHQSQPVTHVVGGIGDWPLIGGVVNYLWPDDQSYDAAIGLMNVRHPADIDQSLINWILSLPDNSLEPSALFMQALMLSVGDVEMALLACHNALASVRTDKDRANTPLALKLVKASDTDNVGAWYHFFAAAYCSYRRPQPFYFKVGVIVEDAVSYFKESLDDTERKAGLNGVDFGILLRTLPCST